MCHLELIIGDCRGSTRPTPSSEGWGSLGQREASEAIASEVIDLGCSVARIIAARGGRVLYAYVTLYVVYVVMSHHIAVPCLASLCHDVLD